MTGFVGGDEERDEQRLWHVSNQGTWGCKPSIEIPSITPEFSMVPAFSRAQVFAGQG
jgi:hypothetical protein